MNVIDRLFEEGYDKEDAENAITIDGMNDAIIGYCEDEDYNLCFIYDYHKIINIFVERDEMTVEEAMEFISYNFSFPKEQAPVIMYRLEN